jgi:predicted transcriptional regulator
MKIVEKKFRGSQLCKVMSYPITYVIVRLLLEKGPMDLDTLVKQVEKGKSTVCMHLGKLRMANIVRFDKQWRKTVYFVKYPEEINNFMKACDKVVERITRRLKKDV